MSSVAEGLISLVIIWRKRVFVLIPCTVGTDGCRFGDCVEIECFLYFLFCWISAFKWEIQMYVSWDMSC